MKLPSEENLTEVFNSLAKNGFDFLEQAIEEVSTKPKFSVVHFSTGLELLLKARLFMEHWSLIATTPHKATWTELTKEGGHTIGANDSLLTLEKLVGKPNKEARDAFSNAFNHRNRTLHFVPHEDQSQMVSEQFTAWYYLHKLLDGDWNNSFTNYTDRISSIESGLLGHRQFLQNKYDDIKNKLEAPKSKGRLGLCYICNFESVVVDDSKYSFFPGECQVCCWHGQTIRFDCGKLLPLEQLPLDCTCDAGSHSLEYIEPRTKDELNDPPQPWCLECGAQTIVDLPRNHEYLCLECKELHLILGYCEKCFSVVAGGVSEDSMFLGCVACQW